MDKKNFQDSMLTPAQINRILHDRAIKLASPLVKQQHEEKEHYIHFLLGDNQHYGFPFGKIKAVLSSNNITFIPSIPSYYSGVINSPYGLLPIVNLTRFFNINSEEIKSHYAWIIVVENDMYSLGLEVKKILMSESYLVSQLEKSLSHFSAEKMQYIIGIVAGEIAIISVQKIIDTIHKDIQTKTSPDFGGRINE